MASIKIGIGGTTTLPNLSDSFIVAHVFSKGKESSLTITCHSLASSERNKLFPRQQKMMTLKLTWMQPTYHDKHTRKKISANFGKH